MVSGDMPKNRSPPLFFLATADLLTVPTNKLWIYLFLLEQC